MVATKFWTFSLRPLQKSSAPPPYPASTRRKECSSASHYASQGAQLCDRGALSGLKKTRPFCLSDSKASEIKKSENQKMKKWSLRNDFHTGTTPVKITEMGSMIKSFFEEHEVI